MAKQSVVKAASGALPSTFKEFVARFPDLGRAHESVARAVDGAGPLDARTLALIKIGICIGAGLESALRGMSGNVQGQLG